MQKMERAVKVDYFCFTTRRTVSEVCSLFSYLANPLQVQERGLYGYQFSMVSSDGVTLLFSPNRPDLHVQITGRGCDRELFDLCTLLSEGDSVTRLDIAIDCIGSGFSCSEIWGLLRQGDFLAVSTDIRQVQGLLSRGGVEERLSRNQERWSGAGTCEAPNGHMPRTRTNSGHTIYLGSSSSDRMVRIYDKGAESGTGADWLRFEIQLRRESANQFYQQSLGVRRDASAGPVLSLSRGLELSALALLNKQLRLLEPGQHAIIAARNYHLLKLHPFWSALVEKIGALKLKIPKTLKTVVSTMKYVKGVAASLKMLKGVMPDYKEFVHGLVDDAVLKPRHIAIQDDLASAYLESAYADSPDVHVWDFTPFDACNSQADQYRYYLATAAV